MTIKIGDVVYQKKLGWSGVPMTVVALTATTAVCRGADGWKVLGLYSSEHRDYVSEFSLARLTHLPDSMIS